MKNVLLLFVCSTLLISCSVRIEKRIYNKGYYVHFQGRNNLNENAVATFIETDTACSRARSDNNSSVSLPAISPSLKEHKEAKILSVRAPRLSGLNFAPASFEAVADDTVKVLVVHAFVGDTIDLSEKIKYHLFDFWDDKNFVSARFIEKNGDLFLEGTMKDGEVKTRPFTEQEFNKTTTQISKPIKEDMLDEDVVTGLLIALYIFLALLLISVLLVLSIFLLLVSRYLGSLAFLGSIALVTYVVRAMISSIEDRQY